MADLLSFRFMASVAVCALTLIGCGSGQGNGTDSARTYPETPQHRKEDFSRWLDAFMQEPVVRGLTPLSMKALRGLQPNMRVLELDRQQPEFTQSLGAYVNRAVSDQRVAEGRALLKKHAALLRKLESEYGVQPRFLVAFWGMETNYGRNFGGFLVPDSLATLAWDGRRSAFFRNEFLQALLILEDGHISPDRMRGSWAGAMGHFQFMPSTFRSYAVDYDRDGRIDIWGSLPDAFASAARYLAATGWQRGQGWGRQVKIPGAFDFNLADFSVRKPVLDWARAGITQVHGKALPKAPEGMQGSLIIPDGAGGPTFLVYDNFHSIMQWNRSVLYALAVGHLADRLVGYPALSIPKSSLIAPLSRSEILEMQTLLNDAGYDAGVPDGLPGQKTRNAIRNFQNRLGHTPDAYPGQSVLDALRATRIAPDSVHRP